MRKLIAIMVGLAGLALAGAAPASANAGAGLAHKPAAAAESGVTKVWHRHHGGGLRFGLYFGAPSYAYYPRYRYYDDYYYRPRYYSYYSDAPRRHRRHWCGRHDRWEW